MLPLKTTLLLNGISSGITGAVLALFPVQCASLFGVNAVVVFQYTGVFLVLFAAWVISAAIQKRPGYNTVSMITLVDVCWVIASILLLAVDGHLLTLIGNLLVAGVALWVAAMAALQYRGLRSLQGNQATTSTATGQ